MQTTRQAQFILSLLSSPKNSTRISPLPLEKEEEYENKHAAASEKAF